MILFVFLFSPVKVSACPWGKPSYRGWHYHCINNIKTIPAILGVCHQVTYRSDRICIPYKSVKRSIFTAKLTEICLVESSLAKYVNVQFEFDVPIAELVIFGLFYAFFAAYLTTPINVTELRTRFFCIITDFNLILVFSTKKWNKLRATSDCNTFASKRKF